MCVGNACLLFGAASAALHARVCVCVRATHTRSHFVAENKANIIADVAVSTLLLLLLPLRLPAATSLRRRQACVCVCVCEKETAVRSCAEHALVSSRAQLSCCAALRGSSLSPNASARAATTKMAALKYLTPLSMLRKYFAKASYNSSNNSHSEKRKWCKNLK